MIDKPEEGRTEGHRVQIKGMRPSLWLRGMLVPVFRPVRMTQRKFRVRHFNDAERTGCPEMGDHRQKPAKAHAQRLGAIRAIGRTGLRRARLKPVGGLFEASQPFEKAALRQPCFGQDSIGAVFRPGEGKWFKPGE